LLTCPPAEIPPCGLRPSDRFYRCEPPPEWPPLLAPPPTCPALAEAWENPPEETPAWLTLALRLKPPAWLELAKRLLPERPL
jgi:hypothetical protein